MSESMNSLQEEPLGEKKNQMIFGKQGSEKNLENKSDGKKI